MFIQVAATAHIGAIISIGIRDIGTIVGDLEVGAVVDGDVDDIKFSMQNRYLTAETPISAPSLNMISRLGREVCVEIVPTFMKK